MIDVVPAVKYIDDFKSEGSESAFKRFYMAVALAKILPSAHKLSEKYLEHCYYTIRD